MVGFRYESRIGLDRNTTKALQLYHEEILVEYVEERKLLDTHIKDGSGEEQDAKKDMELSNEARRNREEMWRWNRCWDIALKKINGKDRAVKEAGNYTIKTGRNMSRTRKNNGKLLWKSCGVHQDVKNAVQQFQRPIAAEVVNEREYCYQLELQYCKSRGGKLGVPDLKPIKQFS